MSKYKFVGDGIGVPGLPHELTDEDVAALGVEKLLEEAVKNGNYVEVSDGADPHPSLLPLREKVRKAKEVNNE